MTHPRDVYTSTPAPLPSPPSAASMATVLASIAPPRQAGAPSSAPPQPRGRRSEEEPVESARAPTARETPKGLAGSGMARQRRRSSSECECVGEGMQQPTPALLRLDCGQLFAADNSYYRSEQAPPSLPTENTRNWSHSFRKAAVAPLIKSGAGHKTHL